MKQLPLFVVQFVSMDAKVPILCGHFCTDPYIRKSAAKDFIANGLKRYALARNWSYRDFEEKSHDITEAIYDYMYNNGLRDSVCDPLHIALDDEQDSLIVQRVDIYFDDGWVYNV